MTSWMLDLWFDLQLTYFYFWSTYDFGQRMTRYDSQWLDEWLLAPPAKWQQSFSNADSSVVVVVVVVVVVRRRQLFT